MDIRRPIVRDYLESLTEKEELNKIFPILLESMGFRVLSTPKDYIGVKEYGKDIVAVGKDEDGVEKRFYFELKGGKDRNITEGNVTNKDGIHNSIIHATYQKFISKYPNFENLPLKIVIVHNGTVSGTIQSTLDSFLIEMSNNHKPKEFDRWDIAKLTQLFADNLFNKYLLVDNESIKLFNMLVRNLTTVNDKI